MCCLHIVRQVLASQEMNFTYLPTLRRKTCWSRPLLPFHTEGTVSISASPSSAEWAHSPFSLSRQSNWKERLDGIFKGGANAANRRQFGTGRIWARKEKKPMHLRHKICFQRSIRLRNISNKGKMINELIITARWSDLGMSQCVTLKCKIRVKD